MNRYIIFLTSIAMTLASAIACDDKDKKPYPPSINRPETETDTTPESKEPIIITPTTEPGGYIEDLSLLRYTPGMQINVDDKTFSSRLSEVAEAGFKYVELKFKYAYGLTTRSDEEVNRIFASMQEQLDAKGITVWSIHLPYDNATWNNIGGAEDIRSQSVAHLIRVMRLCCSHFKTCRNFVTHASKGVLSPRSQSISQAKKSLGEMVPVANQLGVRICVENLVGSLCYYYSELESVCKDFPEVYYTFDIGHANCKGYDVVEFLQNEGTRLGTVHIHDTIFNSGKDTHMMVWEGDIKRWGEVYKTMLETNRYRGVFMFEPQDSQSAKDVMAAYERVVSDFIALMEK